MKHYSQIWHFLIVLFLLPCFLLSAYALQQHTGLDTEPVPEDSKTEYLDNINMVLSDVEIRNLPISCFDANQNGYYALGFDESPENIVSIYNSANEFLYGYRFACDGIFSVELADDNSLLVYLSRSLLLAVFDDHAKCLYIASIPITQSNMDYIHDVFNKTNETVGALSYTLERDFPVGSTYSSLVMVDAQGSRHILYDVTTEHTVVHILATLICFAFFFFVVRGAIMKEISKERM